MKLTVLYTQEFEWLCPNSYRSHGEMDAESKIVLKRTGFAIEVANESSSKFPL